MSAPFWFDRAIHSDSASVEVDGAAIHYETWGQTGKPGLVLIHGSNAHREWWRFVALFLAEHFRVAALDSSGNGDSGWRERYSGEVLAVAMALQALLLDWVREDAAEDIRSSLRAVLQRRRPC